MSGWSRKLLCAFVLVPSSCSLLSPSDDDLMGGDGNGVLTGGSSGSGGSTSDGSAGVGGDGGSGVRGGSGGAGGSTGGTGGGAGTSTGGQGGSGGGAGTGGSGGTGGTPSIPTNGLVLWLRADQAIGPGLGVWTDQSGAGHDATQSTAALQPAYVANGLNGLPAVSFDGANDYMDLPAGFGSWSQGLSFYVVSQPAAPTPGDCYIWLQLSNGDEIDDIAVWHEDGAIGYEVAESFVNSGPNALSFAAPSLAAFVHTGSSVSAYVNGSQEFANSSLAAPADVPRTLNSLGAAFYCARFQGLIGEILLYDRALVATEHSDVTQYLTGKWGIP